MAGREKKIVIGRKQSSASPVPPKERTPETSKPTVIKTEPNQSDDGSTKPAIVKTSPQKSNVKSISVKNTSTLAKKITKTVGRKPLSKTLALNIKSREKKPVKIKQQIAKTLLNNAKKGLEGKNAPLLQNGVKPKRIRRKKIEIEMERRRLEEARLAKLASGEPIVEKKKRRRMKKVPTDDNVKKDTVDSSNNFSSIDETINSILSQIIEEDEEKIVKKPKLKKKIEANEESIEDVMKDLTYLLKNNDAEPEQEGKKQQLDTKLEPVRVKRPYNKRPKSDLVKKKILRKGNRVNELDNITLDASAKHLIDMLDLSVDKNNQLLLPISARRHSIEKFSIDSSSTADAIVKLRAPLPKLKRVSRVRQSVDAKLCIRNSPRTDILPVLRNGKPRKNSLSDSIETRKRKRLCSDFSGSEKSVSKLSGYESDSSFTDTASFPSSDKMDQKDDQSKLDIKTETSDNSEQGTQTGPSDRNCDVNGLIKDDVKEENVTDSNSNVCSDVKTEVPLLDEDDALKPLFIINNKDVSEYTTDSVNSKVPEKSIILDRMKETFNVMASEDQDKVTIGTSTKESTKDEDSGLQVTTLTFYGLHTESADQIICDNTKTRRSCSEEQTHEIEENYDDTIEKPIDCASGSVDLEDDINAENDIMTNKDESKENLSLKGDILQALGLQSLKAAEEAKKEKIIKPDYTGTLKTVIKLNRGEKKRGRGGYKLTLHKHKNKLKENESNGTGVDDEQKNIKEITSGSWKSYGVQSSDMAGALRKSHYFNRSNMDGSSEHTSDGDVATVEGDDSGKVLVIPEKASSFSIHPGRLCKDECSYCFGKFGLFDTPCHIAQMKSVERQDKILQTEKHLTRDSCLCDACYRHVDRKSNTPSYLNKGSKRNSIVAPGPRQNHCHVLGCGTVATNILRRKWLIKMRKSVREVINIDLENPGLHSIPICSEHYLAVEHLMVCAMCKRKLARNHVHYLGSELTELTCALNEEGIPMKLIDRPVVCKLCRYFTSIVMKPSEERLEDTKHFFNEYKKRLLAVYDVERLEEGAEESDLIKDKVEKEPIKKKRRSQKTLLNGDPPHLEQDLHTEIVSKSCADNKSSSKSRSESPSDYMIDYHTLIPSIAMDCESDVENSKRETTITPITKYSFKSDNEKSDSNTAIKSKSGSSKTCAVQRLGSNPCISVRQLFPGEEEVGLQACIEFGNVKEKTPEGWEKCNSIIQYDNDTKLLWQELQKPYGNQSSFLRHLILLEKYFRSGDLVLSANASHHSVNYSESVQNRLRAYDNIPLSSSYTQSQKKTNASTKQLSIINAANIPKNTPITISQITNIAPTVSNKLRNPGVPPGLISLHPGTARPVGTALIKNTQSSQIKIPITKNWRPKLIPIDSSKTSDFDKKPGHVKVMSGGKPYHITMDDYNRMCAIKKSYDLKQKRLLESQNAASSANHNSQFRSILPRSKGVVISKTATVTSPQKSDVNDTSSDVESNLDKLDKTVENLENKLTEPTSMLLPKIPKSLTVIPQTVSHKSSTTKPKPTTNS